MHKFFLLLAGTIALVAASSFSHASVTATVPEGSGKLIVIDAGHGGHDTGASNPPALESTIALEISKLVRDRLEKAGYRVLMTRTKDEWVSLEKRALIANRAAADLFVSIHLNSSTDTRAQGKEFYFQNQVPVDEEALFLADRENRETHSHDSESTGASPQDRATQAGLRAAESARLPDLEIENKSVKKDVRNILEDLDRSARVRRSSELAVILNDEWKKSDFSGRGSSRSGNRAIRQAPFFLVSNVAMPSVLVEVGFLSHKHEGQRLQDAAYQVALSNALASGIQRWTSSSPAP